MSGWGIFGLTLALGFALGSIIYNMVKKNQLTPQIHDRPSRPPSDTRNGRSRNRQTIKDSNEENENEQNTQMNCTMCHRSLSDGAVQTLECGHIFHAYCINKNWFEIVGNRSCPTCRRGTTTNNN